MPCSIPPPILKYQHFASNGPYAPRACKPKSIATYYKTALQILHRSQNLLLGMLLACQLAEQRLGLSKEICKRMAGYTRAHVKADNSLWLTGAGVRTLLQTQLGERRQDKLPHFQNAPSPQREGSEVSLGFSCRGFSAEQGGLWSCGSGPNWSMLWEEHGFSSWTL